MPKSKDQSILFIAYYFPPIKSIAVVRNYNLAKELKSYYSQVHVITTSNNKILTQEFFSLDMFRVEVSPTFDYRTVLNLFSRKKKTHYSENRKNRITDLITKLNLSFPFNLIWGEGGLVYIVNGYRKASRIICENEVAVIHSSFMPYSDHAIAYLLKRKFRHLLWNADFRDLHVDPIRKEVYFPNFQRWCNRRILSKADMVTTVSEGLASHLRAFNSNVVVMRNGIPENRKLNELIPQNEKFTISYTGSIYTGFRSPMLLLRAIKELIDERLINEEDIQIVYAGKDSDSWFEWISSLNLGNVFIDKGLVPSREAFEIQCNSDCNLLLSWASKELQGLLTGKFYEYLVANRPIINITLGGQDPELESLLTSLGVGKMFYEDSFEELKDYVLLLMQEWQDKGKVNGVIAEEDLRNFYWKKLASDFVESVNSKS